jgi:hypothetical protein
MRSSVLRDKTKEARRAVTWRSPPPLYAGRPKSASLELPRRQGTTNRALAKHWRLGAAGASHALEPTPRSGGIVTTRSAAQHCR